LDACKTFIWLWTTWCTWISYISFKYIT